jgi:hypothetical protein
MAMLFAIVSSGTRAGDAWPTVSLPKACDVELAGPLGDDLKRGMGRLSLAPHTASWLLADTSFAEKHIFTNYSGEVSGRFLELASLISPSATPIATATGSVSVSTDLPAVVLLMRPTGASPASRSLPFTLKFSGRPVADPAVRSAPMTLSVAKPFGLLPFASSVVKCST